MENPDFDDRDGPAAAELAVRHAIETDAGDWRAYAALARALLARKAIEIDPDDRRPHAIPAGALAARKRVQEAVVVARRAVALAPDEPEARLALADALLAVVPRRIGTRTAAFAEIDQAELLGADARELDRRHDQPKGMGYWGAVWVAAVLFWSFGLNRWGGAIGTAVAWPAVLIFLIATIVVRLRPPGRSLREALDLQRKLSRKRLATEEQVWRSAPAGTAALAFLVLPAAYISIPTVGGKTPPPWLVWLVLAGIPPLVAAAWVGVDRWLRPRTVIRALRRDAFVASSVSLTFVLAMAAPALDLLKMQRPGIWFTLFIVQMAWIFGSLVAGAAISSRRKKAAV